MSNEHGGGWANPGPAGLVALAIACFTFFSIFAGKVGHGAIPLLGCWLIGGFVVQLTVGIIELREGALLGGNIFLFFSAFFMLAGGLEMFVKAYFNTVGGAPLDGRIDGWAWTVLVIILIFWTFAYLKTAPAVLSLCVIVLDIGVIPVPLMDLGLMSKAAGAPVAAYGLLGAGILGMYVATAIILNTAFGKTILPMPGPILK